MKKFIASVILIVATLFICVGIYNFPKGNRPIFSNGVIHVNEVVRRFHTDKFEYEWKVPKNKSRENFPQDSDWEIYIGSGRFMPEKKCTCSCSEEKYAPWAEYPKEIHPKWKSWDSMWGPKESE